DLDVMRSLGPFRRYGDQTHLASRGVLPAAKLVEIRTPHPALRMRPAGSVLRRNMRTFDMKSFDRRAFRDALLGLRKIGKSARHVVRRAGDHGWIEARRARRMEDHNGPGDLLMRRMR